VNTSGQSASVTNDATHEGEPTLYLADRHLLFAIRNHGNYSLGISGYENVDMRRPTIGGGTWWLGLL
jgi:hypothetical protein